MIEVVVDEIMNDGENVVFDVDVKAGKLGKCKMTTSEIKIVAALWLLILMSLVK